MPKGDADLALPSAAVSDAGPIIHLDELAALHILSGFRKVLVPEVVAEEARRHRAGWHDRAPSCVGVHVVPAARLDALRARLGRRPLDPGELAALALWEENREAVLLCDDGPARAIARELGCEVTGTLGLLLWAFRRGHLPSKSVRDLLNALPERTSLHIRQSLIEEALRELDHRP